jgi:predicted site-specific integrase-resolvase
MQVQLVGSFTQASQRSGKSVYTLQRWARQGKIKTTKDVHGRRCVILESLDKALGLEVIGEVAA